MLLLRACYGIPRRLRRTAPPDGPAEARAPGQSPAPRRRAPVTTGPARTSAGAPDHHRALGESGDARDRSPARYVGGRPAAPPAEPVRRRTAGQPDSRTAGQRASGPAGTAGQPGGSAVGSSGCRIASSAAGSRRAAGGGRPAGPGPRRPPRHVGKPGGRASRRRAAEAQGRRIGSSARRRAAVGRQPPAVGVPHVGGPGPLCGGAAERRVGKMAGARWPARPQAGWPGVRVGRIVCGAWAPSARAGRSACRRACRRVVRAGARSLGVRGPSPRGVGLVPGRARVFLCSHPGGREAPRHGEGSEGDDG